MKTAKFEIGQTIKHGFLTYTVESKTDKMVVLSRQSKDGTTERYVYGNMAAGCKIRAQITKI